VSGLAPGQTYYFALKTTDHAGNVSRISNSPSAVSGIQESLFTVSDQSQPFECKNTVRVIFGDLNGDGCVDLFVGNGGEVKQESYVYLNDCTGKFAPSGQSSPAIALRDITLGDVDGDGYLDLVISGNDYGASIWLNNGNGSFVQTQMIDIDPDVRAVKLVDLDGDGDLDLLLGTVGTRVLFNDGKGHFTDSGQSLGNRLTRSLATGDVDGDGDLDFVQGNSIFSDWPTDNRLFLNNGRGYFKDSGQVLGKSSTYDVRLVDLDGDGYLDLIAGNSNNFPDEIFLNNGKGKFMLVSTPLGTTGNETKGLAVGDIDNNGYNDVVTGDWNGGARVYTNDGAGHLLSFGSALGPEQVASVALADVDNDGDLDLLSAARGNPCTLFINHIGTYAPNKSPEPPNNLQAAISGARVKFSWASGKDKETPASLLTYNVRIGRTPGGNEVVSGAIPVGSGNTGHALNRMIRNLPPGKYYWSVQAVDTGYRKSAWATEQVFIHDLKLPGDDPG
jgi:hypothetical protein